MVYTKTFANDGDMKLNGAAMRAIVFLNQYFPAKCGRYWVTASEMRERLTWCGADSSLQIEHVINATRNHNKDGLLDRRRYNTSAYFRLSKYGKGAPAEQRRNGKTIPMPKKDVFSKNIHARQLLKELNDELLRVKELQEGIERGDIHCKLFPTLLFPRTLPCVILIFIVIWFLHSDERCRNFNRPVCRLRL